MKITPRLASKIFLVLICLTLFIYPNTINAAQFKWVINSENTSPLGLEPSKTQWFIIADQLFASSILDGKIVLHVKDDQGNWCEVQKLGSVDFKINTYRVADIDGDQQPEIIAGTVEPGFIYIYQYSSTGWVLMNSTKYVWSPITNISAGNYIPDQPIELLVQNQEGSLFLLRINDSAIDLVWKSPSFWRPIYSTMTLDLDNDQQDEVLVTYKTGGIAILKVTNNAVVSLWENYPWGKILATTVGDWDNDGFSEIIFSTSQKIIYLVGWTDKGYQFEDQLTQYNFLAEQLSFLDLPELKQLLVTDTAGKTRLLQYSGQQWEEKSAFSTGRVLQIIKSGHNQMTLWTNNRKFTTLKAVLIQPFRIIFQEAEYLTPNIIFVNDIIYISPRSLMQIPNLNFFYEKERNSYRIGIDEQTLEISNKAPFEFKCNGETTQYSYLPLIVEDDLYLPLESVAQFLQLDYTFSPTDSLIILKRPIKS